MKVTILARQKRKKFWHLLYLLLLRLSAANRKTWVKSWVSLLQAQGECANIVRELIDNLHNKLTFDQGKKNKIVYCSQKEHLEISRIAKFGGERL